MSKEGHITAVFGGEVTQCDISKEQWDRMWDNCKSTDPFPDVDFVELENNSFDIMVEDAISKGGILRKWRKNMEQNRLVAEDETKDYGTRRLAQGKFYAYRNCIKDLMG